MAYRQEELKPYDAEGEKTALVEQMFDNIAPSYDALNHGLSWNIDRRWRRKAIGQLRDARPQTILDIATGTGDLAILAAQTLRPRQVVGVDISERMMEIGRKKVAAQGLGDVISFRKGDCMRLPFRDDSFDAVTAAFGIRNFQDLDKGLREMLRVLKPGGRISIVELTTPVGFPMRQLFWLYSNLVLPLWGRIVSKDRGAYGYLNRSIAAFPQGERMMEILAKAGFVESRFKRLTFGVCTMYMARKSDKTN